MAAIVLIALLVLLFGFVLLPLLLPGAVVVLAVCGIADTIRRHPRRPHC